jgi:hypothetical protein
LDFIIAFLSREEVCPRITWRGTLRQAQHRKPQPGNSKSEIRNPKQIRMTKIQNKANKIEQKKQNSDG